tara:strand:+ start:395 stop:571 length:177 start_codon:yes stop_codon:yes gene_type:complete
MPLFIDVPNPIRHPSRCRLTFEMMTKELAEPVLKVYPVFQFPEAVTLVRIRKPDDRFL